MFHCHLYGKKKSRKHDNSLSFARAQRRHILTSLCVLSYANLNYRWLSVYLFCEGTKSSIAIFDQYKYGYSVASEDTGNYHARSEARDGETVSGSYKVALPDGRVQIVTYVADDNGFRADVNYEGEAIEHKSDSSQAPPTSPRPSVSHSETHQRARPEDSSPLFRQHVIPQGQFEEERQDFHRALQQQQARQPRPSQPHSQSVRLVPRPVQSPFEKPVTLVPDLEDDLAPTQAPRPINQNLRFHDSIHVTTPSPNPFRLVVEKSRASTYAPPIHTATISAFRKAMVLHNEDELTTPTKRAPVIGAFTPSYKANEQHTTQPTTTYSPIAATFTPLTDSHEQDNSLLSTTLPSSLKLRPAFSHNNFYRLSNTTPSPPVTEPPKSTTTNAHTMRPPHSPTEAPDTSGIYQYHSHNGHPRERETTLYNPDPNSAAYIHALGRTHAVPILLPVNRGSEHVPLHHRPGPPPIVTSSTPRTYYLNAPAVVLPSQRSTPIPPQLVRMIRVTPAPPLQYSSAEGVEIIRGDALRRRLTLKVPEPHETDIYPTPRPRIMIL
ncbi:mucin-2-like [Palaemon carinicauda]|uniref:mucin-2-like n=1 Tax=Palaemon carinicauda TaxID=392227 RepID=UPI0035B65177